MAAALIGADNALREDNHPVRKLNSYEQGQPFKQPDLQPTI